MNRSRIIRGIITVNLLTLLSLILVFCLNTYNDNMSHFNIYIKLLYMLTLLLAIIGYPVIKRKTNKKVKNIKLVYVYRYVYIFLVILLFNLIMSIYNKIPIDYVFLIKMVILFLSTWIIKKIIFNISTSDILAAFTAIAFAFVPTLGLINLSIYTYLLMGIFLISILLFMKILDEVSQHKMKTKTYILLTFFLILSILIMLLFKISSIIWLVVIFATLLASRNIDFTHISLGQKNIDTVKKISIKRLIYKIERIKINKLLVVFFLTAIVTIPLEYLLNKFEPLMNINLDIVKQLTKQAFLNFKSYYIAVIIAIIILEFIGFVLNRKIDLKTTVIKQILFICIVMLYFSGLNIYIKYVIDLLLIIMVVLNISNIYYNRDERIKLLRANN